MLYRRLILAFNGEKDIPHYQFTMNRDYSTFNESSPSALTVSSTAHKHSVKKTLIHLHQTCEE